MSTIVTRSGKGSPLTHAEVDSNFTNLNTDKLELSGGTMTGNLSFGDNDKAIFGAGSDLAVFSNGTDSFIQEYTTGGHLYIDATNLRIRNRNDNTLRLQTSDSGAVDLYYGGSSKLATTATGVDVTGTLTSDGLTLDGEGLAYFNLGSYSSTSSNNAGLRIRSSASAASGNWAGITYQATSGDSTGTYWQQGITTNAGSYSSDFVVKGSTGASSMKERMRISSGGDISFYEDTGTTAKLTWDASAEMLTTSGLTVDGDAVISSTNARLRLKETDTTDNDTQIQTTGGVFKISRLDDDNATATQRFTIDNATGDISFYEDTGTTAKFFWDAAAEALGLGTTNPTADIHFYNSGDNLVETIMDTNRSGAGSTIGRNRFYWNGTEVAKIEALTGSDTTNKDDGQLRFLTRPSGSVLAEAMRITSDGSVGVGTDSPATKLDVQGTTTTNGLNLDALAATIADTAVDIFVYDTRKDSDGGAWRKRTQHTSWYNETLNTATRGSRREFPAVAVIVGEAQQVTIYDGDDPSLPMWMVFNSGTVTFIERTGGNVSCVEMLNGTLCVGKANGYYLSRIEFILDKGMSYSSGNEYTHGGKTVADRNVVSDTRIISNTEVELVNAAVNDVAMTVLPNAPIDAATGLPVPTIAVSTDGGLSVILDSGSVASLANTGGTTSVDFDSNGKVYASWRNGSSDALYSWSSDAYSSGTISFSNYDLRYNDSSWSGAYQSGGLDIDRVAVAQDDYISFAGNSVGVNDYGLHIHSPYALPSGAYSETEAKAELVKITSDYNTGWMNGDIKLATLSDTDDTDVTGSELVTNGTFDTDTSGWTGENGATISVVSGQLQLTTNSSGGLWAYQTISSVPAGTYTVSVDVISNSSNRAYLRVGNSGSNSSNLVNYGYIQGTGTFAQTFTTTSTQNLTVTLLFDNASSSNLWDNVSLRLAEEDRSVNGKGLQVFGTVTKNPVATGADLVAYTNFADNTNYLFQPPNTDMDFGTGDFSVMLWHYHEDATFNDTIYFLKSSSSNTGVQLGAAGSDASYLWVIGPNLRARTSANTVITQAWTHLCYVRRNGVAETWVNGVRQATSVDAADVDSNQGIYIPSDTAAGDGNDLLSLLRVSATAPSPEQIKKIYEDEKVLFQENAQATLYGSSDAVTALAYDDSTNLLHVGTSAGRSVFQGLRRVDNTTTAVGAAISASNGLVADE
jgi:hypothetical protein